ncbi:MAG: flagellar protein FliT [Burkholderiales bacterium]
MNETLLDRYRGIEAMSEQMLAAAQLQDWDEFKNCQTACEALVEQLSSQAQAEPLPESDHAEKAAIMQRILRNDAAIRAAAEPWLKTLDALAKPSMLRI